MVGLKFYKKLKQLISFVGGISKANISHPLSFALAKDNREIKIEKIILKYLFTYYF